MFRRIEYYKVAPEAAKIKMDSGVYLNNTGWKVSFNVAFEPEVGGYQPGMFSATTTTA